MITGTSLPVEELRQADDEGRHPIGSDPDDPDTDTDTDAAGIDPEGIDPDDPDSWPDCELVTTVGVKQSVRNENSREVGVIGLGEWNDTDPETVIDALRWIPGPAIATRSSPGNYHLWCLAVRSRSRIDGIESWLTDPADHGLNPDHDSGGNGVLRVGAKERMETGEKYKDAPEVVAVSGVRDPICEWSRPHLIELRKLIPDHPQADGIESAINRLVTHDRAVGKIAVYVGYETPTDELDNTIETVKNGEVIA